MIVNELKRHQQTRDHSKGTSEVHTGDTC